MASDPEGDAAALRGGSTPARRVRVTPFERGVRRGHPRPICDPPPQSRRFRGRADPGLDRSPGRIAARCVERPRCCAERCAFAGSKGRSRSLRASRVGPRDGVSCDGRPPRCRPRDGRWWPRLAPCRSRPRRFAGRPSRPIPAIHTPPFFRSRGFGWDTRWFDWASQARAGEGAPAGQGPKGVGTPRGGAAGAGKGERAIRCGPPARPMCGRMSGRESRGPDRRSGGRALPRGTGGPRPPGRQAAGERMRGRRLRSTART